MPNKKQIAVSTHHTTHEISTLCFMAGETLIYHICKTHNLDLLQATLPYLSHIRASEGVSDDPADLISFQLLNQALKLNAPFTLDHIDDVVFGGTLDSNDWTPLLVHALKYESPDKPIVDIVENQSEQHNSENSSTHLIKNAGQNILDYFGKIDTPTSKDLQLLLDTLSSLKTIRMSEGVTDNPADLISFQLLNQALNLNVPFTLHHIDVFRLDNALNAEVLMPLLIHAFYWEGRNRQIDDIVNIVQTHFKFPANVIDLDFSTTYPDIRVALAIINRVKPSGNVNFGKSLLGGLNAGQLDDYLGNDLSVGDLNLSDTNLQPDALLTLLSKLNPNGSVNLKAIVLSSMTAEQINSRIQSQLSVGDLNLSNTCLQPEPLLALLFKLNPNGAVKLSEINLYNMTCKQIKHHIKNPLSINGLELPLPVLIDGCGLSPSIPNNNVLKEFLFRLKPKQLINPTPLYVKTLFEFYKKSDSPPVINGMVIRNDDIHPTELLPFLCKAKPTGWIQFQNFDLTSISGDEVNTQLPNQLSIDQLTLLDSKIHPETFLKLVYKLQPKKIFLIGLSLDYMTEAQVNTNLPAPLTVETLYLLDSQIPATALLTLVSKLKPKTIVFNRMGLLPMKAEQVNTYLPDQLSVETFGLVNYEIDPDTLLTLLSKLNPTKWIDICNNMLKCKAPSIALVDKILPNGLSADKVTLKDTGISSPQAITHLYNKLRQNSSHAKQKTNCGFGFNSP